MRNVLRYIIHLPLVFRKLSVLHRHSVLLDEATPADLSISLRAWKVIKRDYGYLNSLRENKCVDGQGNPIPWYTYPAIEQLSKWDFSGLDVLEYGSGNSTLWWEQRAKSVTAIENDSEWAAYVTSQISKRSRLLLSPVDLAKVDNILLDNYVGIVDELEMFDVIVIDGVNLPGVRKRCAERALPHLRDGGLLIIDNSDWLPETCDFVRKEGFLEVDFCGLAPLNAHAETTSLFFKGDFAVQPLQAEHPGYSIGGLLRNKDQST